MIQYMSWKHVNVTGNMTRLYLSMSDAVMPNILFRSFMSHSGLGGGGGGGGGGGIWGGGIGGSWGGGPRGGGPMWWGCIGGGASSSYLPMGRIPYFPPAGPYRLMVFSRELPLQCILGSCTLKWTVCKEKEEFSLTSFSTLFFLSFTGGGKWKQMKFLKVLSLFFD